KSHHLDFSLDAIVAVARRFDGTRSGIARNSRLSELQDSGDPGEERDGAQVRAVQSRVPDQGRYPGHAHRRGHHRAVVKILLVRLRLIGDVVFTTPVIRALRRRYPNAQLSYLVEPAAAPIVSGNP